MEALLSTLLLLGLFAVRFLVPLLITVGAGYVLVRLDRRWQAAAEAERQAWLETQVAEQPVLPRPMAPDILPLLATPCWVQKGCEPAVRARCPAYLNPNGPCWLTRLNVEGKLPRPCLTCTLFAQDVARDVPLPQADHRRSLFAQHTARD